MTEQRFLTLISLQLTGEYCPEEKDELTEFLLDRPEMQLRSATMENFWNAHPAVNEDQVEKAYKKHLQRMDI